MPAGNISFVRFNAVGEQETQDWLQALDAVNNRIDTLERKVTSHTASMSQAAMDLSAVSKRVDNCTTDITAYKRYIENRFKNNEEVCQREFLDLRSMANTTQQCLESLLPRRLNAIEEQIGLLGQQTAELLSILANTDTGSRARSYNISTPVDRGQPRDAAEVEVPDTPRTDQHPRPSAGLFGERYDSRFGSRERTRATAIRSQLDNHSPMALLLAVMKVQVNIHELQHLQTKPAPKTSATMRLSPGHKCASARLTNMTLQLHDPSLEPRRCHHPSMGATTSHRARPLTHKDDGTPMVLGDLLSETMPTLRG